MAALLARTLTHEPGVAGSMVPDQCFALVVRDFDVSSNDTLLAFV